MWVVDGVGKEKKAYPSHAEVRRRKVEWVVGIVRIVSVTLYRSPERMETRDFAWAGDGWSPPRPCVLFCIQGREWKDRY